MEINEKQKAFSIGQIDYIFNDVNPNTSEYHQMNKRNI